MKIGITTHYYNSNNYGGNLQAYALCKVLQNNGIDAEQICFSRQPKKTSLRQTLKNDGVLVFTKKAVKKLFDKIKKLAPKNKKVLAQLEKRKQNFLKFNQSIPHSQKVYNQNDVASANDVYDLFITGSDQVWHPSAINQAYSLEFVKEKPKISYAASISKSSLTDNQKEYFKNFLKDYKAVSVREQNAVDILKDLSPVSVDWVLDPTMLLPADDWQQILQECDVKGEYLFCYFLGDDKNQRKRAKEYAKQNGLKIVDIPHLQGRYEKADKNFADISIQDASPEQFLWLIKNAKCVFTDSFHSTVFSLIFKKQFYVFERAGYKGMGGRIVSLLSLFDLNDRFVLDEKSKNLDYVNGLNKIDFSKDFDKFNQMKNKSINFLLGNLNI